MNGRQDSAPVVVVGGGVGGVASALALARLGRRVSLLEQADQIGAIGYGVQIGPNVFPMLQRLGVGDAVLAKAYAPSEILLYELRSGEKLAEIPLRTPEFAQRYGGFPYLAIHRVDLHELLLEACARLPNLTLNQATTVTGYAQHGHGASVTTHDARSIAAGAVIAADGLRSKLRAQMHPGEVPRDTGYVAHRTIVPMDAAPPLAQLRQGVTMWTGPGFHVIYYPLRKRSEMNIVVVVRVPSGTEPGSPAYLEHIEAVMAAAQPEPREVIAAVNMERRWAIADREPIRKWADGRVLLLGDAAHSTLQSLAQGAGMAIEDAVLLGEVLREEGDDYAAAFQRLQRLRFLRTARVQLESRALWDVYHCDGVDAEVRTLQFRERSPQDFYRCADWLWKPIELPTGNN